MAWRFVGWDKYEPEPSSRQGFEETPPSYVREWIGADGSHRRRTTRMEIVQERHAILAAGGAQLYGIFRLLVGFAADRGCLRGWLLDYRGRPASPKMIAVELGLSEQEIREAIGLLASPRLALLTRAPLPTRLQREERPGERPGPDGERQEPTPAPSDEAVAPGPPPSAGDDVEPSALTQPARAGPGGESATCAAEEANNNVNVKGNGASLAAGGQNGCASNRKRNGNGNGNGQRGGCSQGPPGNGNATGKPQQQAATAGRNSEPPPNQAGPGEAGEAASPRSPAPPAGRDTGTPAPGRPAGHHGGSDQTPNQAGPGEAGGSRPPSPARPADAPEELAMDAELWKALADAGQWRTSWEQIRSDRRGGQMAKAVYYCLRLPRHAAARQLKRELIPFANAWQTAASAGLPEASMLAMAEASLRHALHLGEHPPSADPTATDKPGNRSRIWLSQFKRRREKAVRDWLEARMLAQRDGPDAGPAGPT